MKKQTWLTLLLLSTKLFVTLFSPTAFSQYGLAQYCNPPPIAHSLTPAQKQTAAYYGIYALLSHNIYPEEAFYFKLPKHWRKVKQYRDSTGLAYQIFEKNRDGKIIEAVMVFRGTENSNDWLKGNFSSKQYSRARSHVAKFVNHYPQTVKTVTGHSLGGALALFASYEFANITAVGFNTAPRNHHDYIRPNTRVVINEKGDFAKKFYNFWNPQRWLESGNHQEVYYQQFDFVPPSFTKAHDSFSLAQGLLLVGSLQNPELAKISKMNCR